MTDTIFKRVPPLDQVKDEEVSILGQSLRFKTSHQIVKNRFMKASMTEQMASFTPADLKSHGIPSNELVNLYERWGHGEFGLVLTGNALIDHKHLEAAGNVIISKETESQQKLDQLKRIAEAAKSDGAKAIVQLNHAGRQTPYTINKEPLSSSSIHLKIRARSAFGKPKAMTLEQIKEDLIPRYVYAAKQCKLAGFDGIQIHGSHGYLICQFLSAKLNKREDEYGGDVKGRFRIVEEIYREIRKEIPASTGFIIGIKINSFDAQNKLEDVIYITKRLNELGFDFIELSGGTYENWQLIHKKESTKKREAFFLECAAAIKPHSPNTILYLTGGFRTIYGMIRAVESGETDGIGLARPVASEPDLPRKILENEVRSASYNHFEQDFTVNYVQAMTQMKEASQIEWDKCGGNVCFGITDFSHPEEAKNFSSGVVWHLFDIMWTENWHQRPYQGFFNYQHDKNYGSCFSELLKWSTGAYSKFLGFKS